ncbi:Serine phosphatase RsbU, regulator of sigma subunit [Allopseudospirillum japonicum]|uniref:Serine phosphatase RsbU, regulator of sigma subunit n=1 Tax=Allopseudospirillum japonicum TaxID=64971 RepID=A0A1H6R0M1_9GAMM|nr:SpoIIE family protein phosphatase [Allopseudospirillum japonicum]SEI45115.1 Serine phosphatase RsbU, regulator of sigma subunit [Allopseudospirillum japonicum]
MSSLRRRFLISITLVYCITGLLAVLLFNLLMVEIVDNLGLKFSERQARFEQERLHAYLHQEILLARQMASSPILLAWSQDEDNPELKSLALADLASRRPFFRDQSYFFTPVASHHFYYQDHSSQFIPGVPLKVLNPKRPQDIWYWDLLKKDEYTYTLNIDPDLEVKKTKVWINVKAYANEQVVAICGTGIPLDDFLTEFSRSQETDTVNIITNQQGAIQAHPDTRLIDYNSLHKQSQQQSHIFQLIQDPQDQAQLKAAMQTLTANPHRVLALPLNLGDQDTLLAVAYTPELGWFNFTLVQKSQLLTQWPFMPLLALLAISLLILSAWFLALLSRLVLKPLNILVESSRKIAQGDYNIYLHPKDHASDEIDLLMHSFNDMSAQVRDYMSNLEIKVTERTSALQASNRELARTHKKLTDSLDYARLIQDALLPTPSHWQPYFAQVSLLWLPKESVGGDFYFCYPCQQGVYFGLADCTGHGVPGAMMTMLASATLEALIYQHPQAKAGELLHKLHTSLQRQLQNPQDVLAGFDNGLDIALAYRTYTGDYLSFAGAGLDLFYLDKNTQVHTIKGSRKGIGYARTPKDYHPQTHILSLQKMTHLAFCSDGILDQAGGEKGFGLGRKGWQALLARLLKENPQAPEQAIQDALLQWRCSSLTKIPYPQRDDISCVYLKLH